MYTRWKQIKAKWDTDIGICGFRSRVLVSHSSSSCSRGYFLHYYGPSAREKHFRVHLSPLFHNRLSLSRWDICCSSCYISSPRFRRSHLWCLWLKTGTELNVLITTFFNQTKTRYWHARPAQNNQITEKQVSKFQECRPWVNRSKCHCQSAHLSGNTFLSCIFMLCLTFFLWGGAEGGKYTNIDHMQLIGSWTGRCTIKDSTDYYLFRSKTWRVGCLVNSACDYLQQTSSYLRCSVSVNFNLLFRLN